MRSSIRYLVFIAIYITFLIFFRSLIDLRKGLTESEVTEISVESKFRQYWGEYESIPVTTENIKQPRDSMHLRDVMRISSNKAHLFDFDSCSMVNCFDYARCNSTGPVKVHILPRISSQNNELLNFTGESNIIHSNILKIIRESHHYEPDPQKACLFMLSDDTLDRDPLSKSFRSELPDLLRPEHNFGMNYLVINLYSGTWPDYRENDFAKFNIGAALLAKASNSITYHRPEFDVSIPLFSYMHPFDKDPFDLDRSQIEAINRTYFLTFKGKRYLVGGGSNTRNSLYHLDNKKDVIMLTTCRHGKKWREVSDNKCDVDESTYDQYDFNDLMRKSLFCLTPRGRRLGSFRFLEALSYNCIPIVLSDGWVWPFGEIIDWSLAAIQLRESMIFNVPDMLRDLDSRTIRSLQQNCREYYQRYFSTTKKIVLTIISIVEKRIKNQLNLPN